MEVAVAMDFDFGSSSSSPYGYTSAPSSPTRLKELYCEFDELLMAANAKCSNGSLATVPFAWEEKPGVPKTPKKNCFFEDEFSFDVSCGFGNDSSVPADDLFHGGVIKTIDLFPLVERSERGRERGFSSNSRLPSSRSRRTRSLSPLGASDYRREQKPTAVSTNTNSKASTTLCSSSENNGSRKWSFKDLFLFRSASDGRTMDKYPLKKYSTNIRKQDQDLSNSRESGSVSKRRGRVSAHEQHYNLNRAASNDLKKKTYLPYKQGILGGLSF